MNKDHKRTSKFLSLVLRHSPETIGIRLDEQGWVEIDLLLSKMASAGHPTSREFLEEVVRTSDKQRFAISEDGQKIRANQGHSVTIDLGLTPETPPDLLLHGTGQDNLESILAQGLHSGARQHVHLSVDPVIAKKVGTRHGKPVILEIDAQGMVEAGHVFYLSANSVWLTDCVPPQFIRLLE